MHIQGASSCGECQRQGQLIDVGASAIRCCYAAVRRLRAESTNTDVIIVDDNDLARERKTSLKVSPAPRHNIPDFIARNSVIKRREGNRRSSVRWSPECLDAEPRSTPAVRILATSTASGPRQDRLSGGFPTTVEAGPGPGAPIRESREPGARPWSGPSPWCTRRRFRRTFPWCRS